MDTLLERLLESSAALESVTLDARGVVTAVNGAFARRVGLPAERIVGRPLDDFVAAHEAARVRAWCNGSEPAPPDSAPVNFLDADGAPYTLWSYVDCLTGGGARLVGEAGVESDQPAADDLLRLTNDMATLARENARRRREVERTQQQLAEALEELRGSYWHLQKIQEVLPVCMKCGRVKSGESRWESVADYLRANEIFMSHGYCPPCADIALREAGFEPGE